MAGRRFRSYLDTARSQAELLETAQKMRSEMIEIAVEMDDEIMENYLDGNEPTVDEIRKL